MITKSRWQIGVLIAVVCVGMHWLCGTGFVQSHQLAIAGGLFWCALVAMLLGWITYLGYICPRVSEYGTLVKLYTPWIVFFTFRAQSRDDRTSRNVVFFVALSQLVFAIPVLFLMFCAASS